MDIPGTDVSQAIDVPRWHALYTRARFEKKVDFLLKQKGLESYLPLQNVVRQWSDRKKTVEMPLFSCYVFVHIPQRQHELAVQTYGVVRMVGFNGRPSVILDEEIEAIRRVLKEVPVVEPVAYLRSGRRVEIVRGPLMGLRGRLVEMRGSHRFIIAIEEIQQALSIEIDISDVRPVR